MWTREGGYGSVKWEGLSRSRAREGRASAHFPITTILESMQTWVRTKDTNSPNPSHTPPSARAYATHVPLSILPVRNPRIFVRGIKRVIDLLYIVHTLLTSRLSCRVSSRCGHRIFFRIIQWHQNSCVPSAPHSCTSREKCYLRYFRNTWNSKREKAKVVAFTE